MCSFLSNLLWFALPTLLATLVILIVVPRSCSTSDASGWRPRLQATYTTTVPIDDHIGLGIAITDQGALGYGVLHLYAHDVRRGYRFLRTVGGGNSVVGVAEPRFDARRELITFTYSDPHVRRTLEVPRAEIEAALNRDSTTSDR